MPPLDQLPAAYLDSEAKRAALEQEVTTLRAQVAWLQRKLFGPGQSERVNRAQLQLELAELEKLSARAEAAEPQKVSYERQSAKPRRDPAEAFAKLPVQETVVIEPAEVQAEPEAFEKISEERTFEVDITPPRLYKRDGAKRRWTRRRRGPGTK